MANRFTAALAAATLAVLLASAHADSNGCYCSVLAECGNPVTFAYSTCTPSVPTPANILTGYTFTVGKYLVGSPISGQCYPVGPGLTLANLGMVCNSIPSCKGFTLDYLAQPGGLATTSLQACYWSDVSAPLDWSYLPLYQPVHILDQRCFGIYVKNPPTTYVATYTASPPPPVASPPPPATTTTTYTVGGACDCNTAYANNIAMRTKCIDCQNTNQANPSLCCACPATSPMGHTDPLQCLDCIVTANPGDKASCTSCWYLYPDNNALTRCYECVKLAGNRASVVAGVAQRDLCLQFCSSKNLPDASQCMDCVKDDEALFFTVLPQNPNGQCPHPGGGTTGGYTGGSTGGYTGGTTTTTVTYTGTTTANPYGRKA